MADNRDVPMTDPTPITSIKKKGMYSLTSLVMDSANSHLIGQPTPKRTSPMKSASASKPTGIEKRVSSSKGKKNKNIGNGVAGDVNFIAASPITAPEITIKKTTNTTNTNLNNPIDGVIGTTNVTGPFRIDGGVVDLTEGKGGGPTIHHGINSRYVPMQLSGKSLFGGHPQVAQAKVNGTKMASYNVQGGGVSDPMVIDSEDLNSSPDERTGNTSDVKITRISEPSTNDPTTTTTTKKAPRGTTERKKVANKAGEHKVPHSMKIVKRKDSAPRPRREAPPDYGLPDTPTDEMFASPVKSEPKKKRTKNTTAPTTPNPTPNPTPTPTTNTTGPPNIPRNIANTGKPLAKLILDTGARSGLTDDQIMQNWEGLLNNIFAPTSPTPDPPSPPPVVIEEDEEDEDLYGPYIPIANRAAMKGQSSAKALETPQAARLVQKQTGVEEVEVVAEVSTGEKRKSQWGMGDEEAVRVKKTKIHHQPTPKPLIRSKKAVPLRRLMRCTSVTSYQAALQPHYQPAPTAPRQVLFNEGMTELSGTDAPKDAITGMRTAGCPLGPIPSHIQSRITSKPSEDGSGGVTFTKRERKWSNGLIRARNSLLGMYLLPLTFIYANLVCFSRV